MNSNNKNPLKSKTLWSAFIIAASMLVPGAKEVVETHPTETPIVLAAVFGLLRLVSRGKITLED